MALVNGERVVGDSLTLGGIIRFPTFNPVSTTLPGRLWKHRQVLERSGRVPAVPGLLPTETHTLSAQRIGGKRSRTPCSSQRRPATWRERRGIRYLLVGRSSEPSPLESGGRSRSGAGRRRRAGREQTRCRLPPWGRRVLIDRPRIEKWALSGAHVTRHLQPIRERGRLRARSTPCDQTPGAPPPQAPSAGVATGDRRSFGRRVPELPETKAPVVSPAVARHVTFDRPRSVKRHSGRRSKGGFQSCDKAVDWLVMTKAATPRSILQQLRSWAPERVSGRSPGAWRRRESVSGEGRDRAFA